MGDVFIEQLVKGKTHFAQKCICFLFSLLAALFCFAGFFLIVLFIPGIALAVYAFISFRNLEVEYEYCLVNNQLDIDKIIAKSKRKSLISIDISNLEVLAPVNSKHLERLQDVKTLDCSVGDENVQTFALVVRNDNETIKIIFNPNNKMMDAIYKMAPRKVFAD